MNPFEDYTNKGSKRVN